ncbi:MAG: glycosyltransferase family 2 protein [Blastocatellia bacterium]
MPLVYVIVLNYNGREWLARCFEALLATRYEPFRVLFIDNASTDDSIELMRTRYPRIARIENEANLGFTEGNNVGIRQALREGADYFVLLNPDTRVEPAWLNALIAAGEAEAGVGILGAVQLEYEGDALNSWTRTAASGRLDPLRDPESAPRAIPMEWVEGACFAVKRAVAERIGLLDSIYFSFYEEIDYCRRAACAGYSSALVPRSRIHHHRGGSWLADARTSRRRNYVCDRSQFIYAATDPRKSLARNAGWYGITLATKARELFRGFTMARAVDLCRMQIDLFLKFPAMVAKWRNDRELFRR